MIGDTIDDAASDDNNVGLNEGIVYGDAVCKSLAKKISVLVMGT